VTTLRRSQMPHDSSVPRPFISDCDPGDETDALAAPSFSEPPPGGSEEKVGNGSSNGQSALARNRAPFPAGF